MEAVTTLPRGRPLTVADLETMPDDGHRYELIEGALIVTPAPSVRHQIVSMNLAMLLRDACPPDLLVARREDFTEKNLPTAPLLAVEVLSPSTQLVDLNLKKAAYEQAGVGSYWTIDPSVPRLVAWELKDGVFVQVADVAADEAWTAQLPYEVTIVPADLVD
jgi:Uma2 family endonuclease